MACAALRHCNEGSSVWWASPEGECVIGNLGTGHWALGIAFASSALIAYRVPTKVTREPHKGCWTQSGYPGCSEGGGDTHLNVQNSINGLI